MSHRNPTSVPDPQYSDFERGSLRELLSRDMPVPAWEPWDVLDGLRTRLDRIDAIAEMLHAHTPEQVLTCPEAVGEMLEREARAMVMLARRVGEIFAEQRLTGGPR